MKALILTPWTGTGADKDSYFPLVAKTYTLQRWIDATNQPVAELQPDPNLYAIEAEVELEVLEKIAIDPTYKILWRDDQKIKPVENELTELKDFLVAQGFAKSTLDAAIGTTVANRERAQIAAELTAHLRTLKKKNGL